MTTLRLKDNQTQDLISAAQNFTASWVQLGDKRIDCRDKQKIALWFNLDVNDSLNMRFRAVGFKDETDSDAYVLPIMSVSSSKVELADEYYEFADDDDQRMIVEIDVLDVLPYVEIQIQAGTAGVSPGQIDEAMISARTERR